MTTISSRRMGRPPLPREVRVVNEFPVGLRLPPAEFERTKAHASREGRSAANFVRRVYLIGLAQYEAEQARTATQA